MPTKPNEASRVYLAVPFAEKDEAKRHGARWNPERRQWWVDQQDIAKHPGISRWFVDDDAVAGVHDRAAGRERRDSVMSAPVRTLATTFDLPVCACSTPPWEHCEHTTPQS
jgi:hypothetical protein